MNTFTTFIRDKSRPSGYRPVEVARASEPRTQAALEFVRDPSRPSGYRPVHPVAKVPASLSWLTDALNAAASKASTVRAAVRAAVNPYKTTPRPPCPVKSRIAELDRARGGFDFYTTDDWLGLASLCHALPQGSTTKALFSPFSFNR